MIVSSLQFERRNRRLGLCHQRSLAAHIEVRNAARPLALLRNLQLLLLHCKQFVRDLDLLANLRLPDRCRHHVTRQHQPRALELPRLVIPLRLQSLNRPPIRAPHIERIRNRHRAIQQRERRWVREGNSKRRQVKLFLGH